jgi:hypothetical protein
MLRVKNLDVTFVSGRLNHRLRFKEETLQMMRQEPDKLVQTRMSSLEDDCTLIGLDQYALGFPLDQVRQAFAEAAAAWLKVFELRGTEDAFPVVVMTVDPTKPEDDPAFRPLHPPGTKDYSSTNSHDCFEAICIALIAGEYDIVDKLAELMWDPPNASYISIHSEYITPNRIHLAYAVKHFLQNNPTEAPKELRRITFRKADQETTYMAKMVRGLVDNNDAFFTEGLLELLYWHRKQAKKPNKQKDPEMYFCLPAVALCILAVRRRLVKKDELPEDPYLPLELIPDTDNAP